MWRELRLQTLLGRESERESEEKIVKARRKGERGERGERGAGK